MQTKKKSELPEPQQLRGREISRALIEPRGE